MYIWADGGITPLHAGKVRMGERRLLVSGNFWVVLLFWYRWGSVIMVECLRDQEAQEARKVYSVNRGMLHLLEYYFVLAAKCRIWPLFRSCGPIICNTEFRKPPPCFFSFARVLEVDKNLFSTNHKQTRVLNKSFARLTLFFNPQSGSKASIGSLHHGRKISSKFRRMVRNLCMVFCAIHCCNGSQDFEEPVMV